MSSYSDTYFLVCAQMFGTGLYWVEGDLWLRDSHSGLGLPLTVLDKLEKWTKAYDRYLASDYQRYKAKIDALDMQGWALAEELWENFNATVEVRYWSEGVGRFQNWWMERFKDCPPLIPRWPAGPEIIETKNT